MEDFRKTVWDYYVKNRRDMPWREEPYETYRILVSEMMLQQTQVLRVIPKYIAFLMEFPTAQALAAAPLSKVLIAWSGLGYNRRAKYLHEAVKQLYAIDEWNFNDLVSCKGIGKNTAAAVVVYSYNLPLVFIETNIRTVFIHHFFNDEENVNDKALLPFIEEAIDTEHPREWCWALMDYGVYLKKSAGNASRQSKQYVKQSKFEGSIRQIRGEVLRVLAGNSESLDGLSVLIPDPRLTRVLQSLEDEGLISRTKEGYSLYK